MQNAASIDRLESRLEVWEDRLALITGALAREMRQPWAKRERRLLMLLYHDKRVCDAVISELNGLRYRWHQRV